MRSTIPLYKRVIPPRGTEARYNADMLGGALVGYGIARGVLELGVNSFFGGDSSIKDYVDSVLLRQVLGGVAAYLASRSPYRFTCLVETPFFVYLAGSHFVSGLSGLPYFGLDTVLGSRDESIRSLFGLGLGVSDWAGVESAACFLLYRMCRKYRSGSAPSDAPPAQPRA